VGTTVLPALTTVARVQPGERVLVLGAAGGVGLAGVQLAHALGAEVVAAASSPERLEVCRAAGADHLVDYGSTDLRTALRATVPDGVDVVLDPVGGAVSEPALRSCRRGGRFVTLGYASGTIPSIPLNLVLLKGVAVLGYDVRAASLADPAAAVAVRAEVFAMLGDGRLRPHVSATFPLERAAEALRLLADRQAVGKLVVEP
jgi:NADPH:quinone reductase-like Zn-dependent oxidoreductase